jgi:hypothetical protein
MLPKVAKASKDKVYVIIDIILKNRLFNAMYRLPCSVLLVLLVATAKIHFEEQVLVAGRKQGRQADKAVRPACFVLGPLVAFALPSRFFTN